MWSSVFSKLHVLECKVEQGNARIDLLERNVRLNSQQALNDTQGQSRNHERPHCGYEHELGSDAEAGSSTIRGKYLRVLLAKRVLKMKRFDLNHFQSTNIFESTNEIPS